MPKYHFHLRSRAGTLVDEEGSDHAGVDAAASAARGIARALLGSDIASGTADLMQSIILTDRSGEVIEQLCFVDAIRFEHAEDERRTRTCTSLEEWRLPHGLPLSMENLATVPDGAVGAS